MVAQESKQKQILVIEDEHDLRQFSTWVLEAEGYLVLPAADGNQGIAIAKQHRVDLIFLDIRMPNRYGWEILEELKSTPELAGTPVVIFTASADIDFKEKAKDMGAVDYLVKPVSALALKECVSRVLGNG
jgi:CheY-like chemotaxis protein